MSEFKSLKVKNTAGDVVCPSDKVGTFALNENLKTINNQSIVGTGNISISGTNSIKVNSEIFNVDSSGNIDIGNVLRDEGMQTISYYEDSDDAGLCIVMHPDSDDSDWNAFLSGDKLNFTIDGSSSYAQFGVNGMHAYWDSDADMDLTPHYLRFGNYHSEYAKIGFESIGDDSDTHELYFEERNSLHNPKIYLSDLRRLTSSYSRTGVNGIPVDYQAVYTTVSANSVLSFGGLPHQGCETHVIIKNTGNTTISITLPNSGSYVCTSEPTIYIAGEKYGEVNVININGTGYVHGVNSI